MHAIQNFAFDEHLVRVVEREGEPWFVGKDVCGCLGIAKHHQALEDLDDDERGTSTVGTPMGDQALIVVSEPGVYRLVFRSRKPEAERFKRWLAHEVLPTLRKTGEFHLSAPAGHDELPDGIASPRLDEPRNWPIIQKLEAVRLAAAVWGKDRTRGLWHILDLPMPPQAPVSSRDEARACLKFLLDTEVCDGELSIRHFLEAALDEDEEARAMLIAAGIRPYPERDAFLIANDHPRILEILERTEWARGRHGRVLRRLAGVEATGTARFEGINRRGALVPADYLDDEYLAAETGAVVEVL